MKLIFSKFNADLLILMISDALFQGLLYLPYYIVQAGADSQNRLFLPYLPDVFQFVFIRLFCEQDGIDGINLLHSKLIGNDMTIVEEVVGRENEHQQDYQ